MSKRRYTPTPRMAARTAADFAIKPAPDFRAVDSATRAEIREDLAPTPVFMSTDSATRKLMPVASGVLGYFPDALLLVSWVSRAGNDKHNPGQPLHWAKEKSGDEADCEARHMLDAMRGVAPDPGLEPLGELGHLASKAWRALA